MHADAYASADAQVLVEQIPKNRLVLLLSKGFLRPFDSKVHDVRAITPTGLASFRGGQAEASSSKACYTYYLRARRFVGGIVAPSQLEPTYAESVPRGHCWGVPEQFLFVPSDCFLYSLRSHRAAAQHGFVRPATWCGTTLALWSPQLSLHLSI